MSLLHGLGQCKTRKWGKYTLGFTEPVKGKGKGESYWLGQGLPNVYLTLIWSYYIMLCRRFVLPRAETSLWQAHQ